MTETGTAADADDPNWACQAPSCVSLAVVTVDAEALVDAEVVMSLMSHSVGRSSFVMNSFVQWCPPLSSFSFQWSEGSVDLSVIAELMWQ